jgi:hypothetical protein
MNNKNPLNHFDKITAEQAAYYGMTVEQFKKHSGELAEAQEIVEQEETDTQTYNKLLTRFLNNPYSDNKAKEILKLLDEMDHEAALSYIRIFDQIIKTKKQEIINKSWE